MLDFSKLPQLLPLLLPEKLLSLTTDLQEAMEVI
jgi:hypothetical protein